MSRLEDLIAELCPDGVETRTLSEISNKITDGLHNLPRDVQTTGEYPVLSAMNIVNGTINTDTTKYVSTETFIRENPRTNVEINDVLLTIVGAIGRVAVVEKKLHALFQRSVCIIKPKQNIVTSSFLRYLLESSSIQNHIQKNAHGAAQKGFYLDQVCNLCIPVPPLAIQEEIVRILDAFTKLKAELKAELKARKEQYEYYRDALLTFDDSIPRMTLGEIATDVYRGSGIKRDEVTPTGIPCVRYGEIYTSYDICFTECISHTSLDVVTSPKYFEYGDVIFAITGESVEEIAKSIVYLGHDKCLAGGDTVVLKHKLEPRYLAYVLSTTDAQKQKSAGKVKSKVVHSSVPALKSISIPVPPIEQQKRIADILDNFYRLTTNISEGLPAEINAREKQYEYYRDQLLTFKPKGIEA